MLAFKLRQSKKLKKEAESQHSPRTDHVAVPVSVPVSVGAASPDSGWDGGEGDVLTLHDPANRGFSEAHFQLRVIRPLMFQSITALFLITSKKQSLLL